MDLPPTIHAAAEQIRAGRLSPVDLLEMCLGRIDRCEERVRAWVTVDREGARTEARRLADELRSGIDRGPLHGVPVGIKDIYDVFDWPTAAGSRLWAQSYARADAPVVKRLRQAGAVLVGKTVTTQYASFDPPPTRNPWGLGRTPGGSSSGSAAALACGMCLGALGSQTGGSITRPAAFCGVCGCKPTYGRLPLDGVVPLAESMDHPGPMARCVRDLALLLLALDAPDGPENGLPAELAQAPSKAAAPVLGRLRGPFDDLAEPAMRDALDRAVERWGQAGATVVDVALPAAFAEVLPRHRVVMAVEAARFHEPRLRRHPDDYGPNIRSLLEEGLACPAPEYARCKAHQRELTSLMEGCLSGYEALLTAAARGPAPDAATTGDPAFNSPWSYTGLPTVCFPIAFSPDGLPLGAQLIGRPWGEYELFPAAAWCEQALGFAVGEPRLG
jgi:aspartyl-tRNA(Asn)/glutamyl-tRNA(Gln) amidotransferase subunit A